MHVDSCITTGYLHEIDGKSCQDYALAGLLDGGAYATVSDGCSTGGRTDVGARVVALATAGAIEDCWRMGGSLYDPAGIAAITGRQYQTIAETMTSLRCSVDDMLATSAFICLSGEGGFVHFQGDGVVAWQLTSGYLVMAQLSWVNEMPFYPIYGVVDKAVGFTQAHGGDLTAVRLTSEWWSLAPNGRYRRLQNIPFSLEQGSRGIVLSLPSQDLRCAAVFTDGIAQIENLDWKDAVSQMMAFKTTAGSFAKRRLIRMVRDSHEFGRGPIDDLAGAIIRL